MEDRSLFISSCSRRDLARRRHSRPLPPLAVAAIALLLAMAAIAAALLAAGTV